MGSPVGLDPNASPGPPRTLDRSRSRRRSWSTLTSTPGSASRPSGDIQGPDLWRLYSGNLIIDGNRIVGVVDWLEADIEDPVQEVAWAAWEFCHNDAGDDLVEESAQAFLKAYSEGGGPAVVEPPVDIIPWTRWLLRREASVALHQQAPDRWKTRTTSD